MYHTLELLRAIEVLLLLKQVNIASYRDAPNGLAMCPSRVSARHENLSKNIEQLTDREREGPRCW